jgi:hypothetical protein
LLQISSYFPIESTIIFICNLGKKNRETICSLYNSFIHISRVFFFIESLDPRVGRGVIQLNDARAPGRRFWKNGTFFGGRTYTQTRRVMVVRRRQKCNFVSSQWLRTNRNAPQRVTRLCVAVPNIIPKGRNVSLSTACSLAFLFTARRAFNFYYFFCFVP